MSTQALISPGGFTINTRTGNLDYRFPVYTYVTHNPYYPTYRPIDLEACCDIITCDPCRRNCTKEVAANFFENLYYLVTCLPCRPCFTREDAATCINGCTWLLTCGPLRERYAEGKLGQDIKKIAISCGKIALPLIINLAQIPLMNHSTSDDMNLTVGVGALVLQIAYLCSRCWVCCKHRESRTNISSIVTGFGGLAISLNLLENRCTSFKNFKC